MHNKASAISAITQYLAFNDSVFFLNGTYQNEKHKLAFAITVTKVSPPTNILFRVNNRKEL